MKKMICAVVAIAAPICALSFMPSSATAHNGGAHAAGVCQPYIIETYGKSSAASRKARKRRAKRRAERRWQRAVEDRLLGARGVAIPAAGTDFSNLRYAEIESFNCSGRPLKCVLRARPCRAH